MLFVFVTFVCLQLLLDLHAVRGSTLPRECVAGLCLVPKVSNNILFFDSISTMKLFSKKQ